MATEQERMLRTRMLAGIVVAVVAAGLLVWGYIDGDQWLKSLGIVFGG